MSDELTYDIRVWSIRVRKGRAGTKYQVRWAVNGVARAETFATRALADAFRSRLLTESRRGSAFDGDSGLPDTMAPRARAVTWYQVAMSFVDSKWPTSSARHRKSIAEALMTITPAMAEGLCPEEPKAVRAALLHYSFNAAGRQGAPTEVEASVHRWFSNNSMAIGRAADPTHLRSVLNTLALRLDGKPAAQPTVARKRAVLYGALQHAVELRQLPGNPLDSLRWHAPRASEEVDRRTVVNPEQASRLLLAVRGIDPALEAFFGCLYFAALRPSEARHLRVAHLRLAAQGWGELVLSGSSQRIPQEWGGGDDQALKHRAVTSTRRVPACPALVELLRRHVDEFGVGTDGRLFVVRVGRERLPAAGPYGRPVSSATYANVWRRARVAALTPGEVASPLARRPYDLRHAAVSLWLNAGVSAPQVAEWAGHSVNVLLKVYAACLDGQDAEARRRVDQALQVLTRGPES